MKKISLLSLMSVCMMAPAFATPSHTSDTFPNDELMQEDYTYTGQANYTNMGAYSGTVTANAEYEWTDITVGAGYYLPQNATSVSACTSGSYCPGMQSAVHYDDTQAQGIETCPTGFTSSDANASANTQCYRACDVANMGANGTITNIAHATTLTGNDYYGAGTDTCTASACENGWTATNGACVANTINITWNGATAAAISANNAGQCTYGGDIRTPSAYDPTAVPTGKHFVGWKFVKTPAAPAAFDLSTLDASINGTSYGWQNDSAAGYDVHSENTTDYGLTEDQTWGTTFSYGKIRGEALCSNDYAGGYGQPGTPDESGTGWTNGCWCRVTEYQAPGSDVWQSVSSARWVANSDTDAPGMCAGECAPNCSSAFNESEEFREAAFGTSSN